MVQNFDCIIRTDDTDKTNRRSFTLVEVLVVLAIIAVMVFLLLPAMNIVRDKARAAKCVSNLGQLNKAVLLYCTDNDGYFPPLYFPDPWYILLNNAYLHNTNLFFCPAATNAAFNSSHISYGYDKRLGGSTSMVPSPYRLANLDNPDQILVFADSQSLAGQAYFLQQTGNPNAPTTVDPRHFLGVNVAWADGHVSWILPLSLTNTANWPISRN